MEIFSVSTCDSSTKSMADHKALRIIVSHESQIVSLMLSA